MPPGGGRDGSGQAGGGSAAGRKAGVPVDAGDHHERRPGGDGPGGFQGAEARVAYWHARAVGARGGSGERPQAAAGAADRGRPGGRAGAIERDGGHASEGVAAGERAVRGVAGGDARRPGIGGGAGGLERGEDLSESSAGEGAMVGEWEGGPGSEAAEFGKAGRDVVGEEREELGG